MRTHDCKLRYLCYLAFFLLLLYGILSVHALIDKTDISNQILISIEYNTKQAQMLLNEINDAEFVFEVDILDE